MRWVFLIVCAAAAAAPPKYVVTVLIDDAGWYDTTVNNPESPTPRLQELADQGIRLDRHYAYMLCSPSRRSFLSGRYPVHISGQQADTCSDYLPLNFTLLSHKMKAAGFVNHFVGKGHLGYLTEDHLPINRGWDTHVGYLNAHENYTYGGSLEPATHSKDFWHNSGPGDDLVDQIWYSTNWYTTRAVDIVNQHPLEKPLWIHLPYQAIHAPYQEPPVWEWYNVSDPVTDPATATASMPDRP